VAVPEKEGKLTIPMESTKKKSTQDRIFTLSDFEKAYACEQPAIMNLIDGKMKEDVVKLLKEDHKIDPTKIDWRKWHNVLFAYAFAIKEAFLAENQKVYSEKASEQLLFLANLYRKKEIEEEKEKRRK